MNKTPEQKAIVEFVQEAATRIRAMSGHTDGTITDLARESAVSVLRDLAKEHGVLVYI